MDKVLIPFTIIRKRSHSDPYARFFLQNSSSVKDKSNVPVTVSPSLHRSCRSVGKHHSDCPGHSSKEGSCLTGNWVIKMGSPKIQAFGIPVFHKVYNTDLRFYLWNYKRDKSSRYSLIYSSCSWIQPTVPALIHAENRILFEFVYLHIKVCSYA